MSESGSNYPNSYNIANSNNYNNNNNNSNGNNNKNNNDNNNNNLQEGVGVREPEDGPIHRQSLVHFVVSVSHLHFPVVIGPNLGRNG